jgi:hypothetical protein
MTGEYIATKAGIDHAPQQHRHDQRGRSRSQQKHHG